MVHTTSGYVRCDIAVNFTFSYSTVSVFTTHLFVPQASISAHFIRKPTVEQKHTESASTEQDM